MSLGELVQGLSQGLEGVGDGAKFSILGFDACLMSQFTVLSALAPFADMVLASEHLEPGDGWDYRGVQPFREDGQVATPQEYATSIIEQFLQTSGSGYMDVTLAAFDMTASWDVLEQAAAQLFGELHALAQEGDDLVMQAVGQARQNTATIEGEWIDFGRFLEHLASELDSDDAYLITLVEACSEAYVGARVHENSSPQGPYTGMSLYWPAGNPDPDFFNLQELGAGAQAYADFLQIFSNVPSEGACATTETKPCNETMYTLSMTDSWGDGWNGAVFSLTNEDGVDVVSVTSCSPYGDETELCLADGTYTLAVSAGEWPSEVGWSFGDVSDGYAPFDATIIVNAGTVETTVIAGSAADADKKKK